MGSEPNAVALIAIALDTFRAVILPTVPREHRLDALMIANALAIAERELRLGEAEAAELIAPLRRVLDDDPNEALPYTEATVACEALARRLCTLIASGAFDHPGPDQDRLLKVLAQLTQARLRVANPKRLPASAEVDQAGDH